MTTKDQDLETYGANLESADNDGVYVKLADVKTIITNSLFALPIYGARENIEIIENEIQSLPTINPERVLEERIQSLPDDDGETLEDIIEDIGKRMCHFKFLYPNAGYWTIQDQYDWQYKTDSPRDAFREFREELKRNGHYY